MESWGIRSRVMLVAVLPAVILAIILTVFFTRSRIADIEDAHIDRGRAFTRQLAAAAEFALFADNRPALHRLAESALSENDVRGLTILGPDGEVVAKVGKPAHLDTMARDTAPGIQALADGDLRIIEAVLPSRLDVDDNQAVDAAPQAHPLGTVILDLSRQRVGSRRGELLMVSLLALVAVLTGSLLLARRMSAGVSGPIRDIAATVQRIGHGHLSERVPETGGGSLRQLVEGINEMAAHLEKSREEMQQRVGDATVELRARKEEAEQATMAKSRFLAAASHDLRQPMHALGLFISELSQQSHPPETRRLVRQIAASAEAMDNLLDSLLDISKLDAGVLQPNPRPFALQAILNRISMDFAPVAEERGLRLRVRPCPLWAHSDPMLLERVLFNLVGNAIRYTREGTVLVACRVRGERIRIEVRDSGIGIPAEAQDIIFQEFVQLENPERARNKGLGLGLAIVRRLTLLLGHTLELRSRPNLGSVFTIEIGRAPPVRDQRDLEAERPPGDLFGTRVAVVDDDPLALASIHSLLVSWGCEVQACTGLDSLLMELSTRGVTPEVVVSDFRLQGSRNGIDVIRGVRNRYDPKLPAILISGDTGSDTLRLAQHEGLVLLHKPVRPAKLRALLNRLLAGRRTDDPGPPPGADAPGV